MNANEPHAGLARIARLDVEPFLCLCAGAPEGI